MDRSDWPRRCNATRRSLILAARGGGESARRALGELYRLYLYPVFQLFAARRGQQYAGELTQAFFAERWAVRTPHPTPPSQRS